MISATPFNRNSFSALMTFGDEIGVDRANSRFTFLTEIFPDLCEDDRLDCASWSKSHLSALQKAANVYIPSKAADKRKMARAYGVADFKTLPDVSTDGQGKLIRPLRSALLAAIIAKHEAAAQKLDDGE